MLQETFQGFQCSRLTGQAHAHQVGQLPEGDDHRCAEGEAEHHRLRDKVDQRAESQQPQQPLKHAGEKGKQQDQGDVVVTAADSQGADTGIENDGYRRGGAADQMPGRAPEASNQHRYDRRIQAIFSGQTGNQGVGDRLWQSQDRTT
ncbi:hypothetical protein D3C78_942690 [compost metagenome]